MPSSLSPEPTIGYIYGLEFFKDFENEFPAIAYNDLKSESDSLIEPSVEGYDEGIVHSYKQRFETIWGRSVNQGRKADIIYYAWRRLFEIRGPLLDGAIRRMKWRQFILVLGLHTKEDMVGARGQAPEKITGVDLFSLRSIDQGTANISCILAYELMLIDLHELGRLNIYFRVGDTWAWVAPGPERQQPAVAGAP
nr:hypothetical protein [Tanacetum cinerariifolium]